MSNNRQVLITDKVDSCLIEGLERAGYACVYRPNFMQAEVLAALGSSVGLVVNSKIKVDATLLRAGSGLEFVARLGSGMEGIDIKEAQRLGIQVHRSPEGNCLAVAEHGLGMLLSLNNRLAVADRELRAGQWRREANRGRQLAGQTAALLGFGHTGRALAQRLVALGLRVWVYDPYLESGFEAAVPGVEAKTIAEMQAEADILSLHLPLTPETRFAINYDFLAAFRKPLTLLNTARGELLPLSDLLKALNEGLVVAAGLDVFEDERPETYNETAALYYPDLFERENVLFTPHIAGWTFESKRALSQVLLEKILGQRPSTLPQWLWAWS